jgi:hypothetical protein
MPNLKRARRVLLVLKNAAFVFRDTFAPDHAAGAGDGTPSSDGKACHQDTDTENKISQSSNQLLFAGGKASPSWGDPGRWWTKPDCSSGWARVAGRTFGVITQHGAGSDYAIGWDDDNSGSIAGCGVYVAAATILGRWANGSQDQIATIAASTDYKLYTMLRTTGAYHYASGGIFGSTPILVALDDALNNATIFPAISNYDGTITISSPLAAKDLPVTTPILSDTFDNVVAVDSGGNGLDGTHVKVGLNGASGQYALTGYTNIYSAGFNTWFNGQEGGMIIRESVADYVGDQYLTHLSDTAQTQQIYIQKRTNGIRTVYLGKSVDHATASTTTNTPALAWSLTNDEYKMYFNGAQTGLTQTSLPTYSVALGAGHTQIGARNLTGNALVGNIADTILFNSFNGNYANIDTTMAAIHTALDAGTLTSAALDGYFGANNWAWYKFNETHTSDGAVTPVDVVGNGSGVEWLGDTHATDSNKAYHAIINGTLDEHINVVDVGASQVMVRLFPTISAGNMGGMAIRVDSATNPQNCIKVRFDLSDNQCHVDKVVGGALTADVGVAAFTYSAGTEAWAYFIGDYVYVVYNGTGLFPSGVLINDAGIINNTKHFSYTEDGATYFENGRIINQQNPIVAGVV